MIERHHGLKFAHLLRDAMFKWERDADDLRNSVEVTADLFADFHLTQSSEIKADEQESRLCLLLADIRSALGDPEGKMMQEDFVQHCKEVVEWLNKLDFADWKGGAIKNRGEYGFALYDLGGCIVEHYKTPLEALTAYLKGKE